MATFNSYAARAAQLKLAVAGLFLLSAGRLLFAGELEKQFAARAETAFHQTQNHFQSDPANPTNAIHFARACFQLAEIVTNATRRAEIARLGIDASKTLIERAPRSAPGHYYLAMNSGELADAEAPSLAAYKLVHEIEREFKTAAELEVQYDFAGPARCLGLLYRDAPGWPLSVGSKHKAREWLERAVALAPDYPDNQLNLAESQLKWHQRDEAEKTLQTIATRWPAAQTNFTGETWEPDWHDWNTRRAALQAELEHPAPTRTNH